MQEILDHAGAGARILDLGCGSGSFRAPQAIVVRVDCKRDGAPPGPLFVQADASRLPFASRSFDVIICNHSLEHFESLKPALREMGRLVRRDGALFVSVPDARTFMDRLYRWLFHGGGHVNLFASAHELEQMLACYSGLPHVATKTLHSSFLYLNRRNLKPPLPRRVRLLSWQWETPVALLAWAARALDRRCRARASVYGWAFYFGNVPEPVAPGGWSNVCIRCGQAHASAWLEELGAVKRTPWLLKGYHCPNCGAANFFTRDDAKANPLDGS